MAGGQLVRHPVLIRRLAVLDGGAGVAVPPAVPTVPVAAEFVVAAAPLPGRAPVALAVGVDDAVVPLAARVAAHVVVALGGHIGGAVSLLRQQRLAPDFAMASSQDRSQERNKERRLKRGEEPKRGEEQREDKERRGTKRGGERRGEERGGEERSCRGD